MRFREIITEDDVSSSMVVQNLVRTELNNSPEQEISLSKDDFINWVKNIVSLNRNLHNFSEDHINQWLNTDEDGWDIITLDDETDTVTIREPEDSESEEDDDDIFEPEVDEFDPEEEEFDSGDDDIDLDLDTEAPTTAPPQEVQEPVRPNPVQQMASRELQRNRRF